MADIPPLFGIDLGFGSMKVCQTKRNGKSFEIAALGVKETGKDMLQSDSDEAITYLSNTLKDAVKDAGISTNNCTITVPEALVYSRLLSLPVLEEQDEEKVSESIYWALKPLIPVEIETVNVSYLEVSSYVKNGQTFMDWYVVAAPKNLVDRIRRFVEKAGLNLLAIETEALANTRTVRANYQLTADTILLDFGASTSNIILVRNGKTAFSQVAEIGSNNITNDIAAGFSIDENQANQYKYSTGLVQTEGQNNNIAQVITPTIDKLVSEISRTVTYSKDKLRSQNISAIYLVGGGSKLPGFANYLQNKLSIQCVLVDPYRAFKKNNKIQKKLQEVSALSDFTVSIGLSLKGII